MRMAMLGVLLIGGLRALAASAAPPESPAPVAATPAGARVENVVLSDEPTGVAKAQFSARTPQLVLRATLVDVPPGSTVSVAWIAEKTTVENYTFASATLVVDASSSRDIHVPVTRPTSGWPPGDYRVDVWIDALPPAGTRFTVVAD